VGLIGGMCAEGKGGIAQAHGPHPLGGPDSESFKESRCGGGLDGARNGLKPVLGPPRSLVLRLKKLL
jgi:hypothetical protein